MKIIEMGRKLTEEELEGIKRSDKYLNGWGDFAMISNNVFIVLKKNDVAQGTDNACCEAKEKMEQVFCQHPDFTTFHMDDGHVLLLLGGIVGVFSKEEIADEDYNDSDKHFKLALSLRSEIFEACEKEEIIALVDIEQ
ncbi:MAG: hypothetical protein IKU25_09305 [Clostridia bacterium]|nr:hypothetical protein [Clostridia bacterium]